MFGSNAKQAASTTTTNQQPQQQPEAEQQEGSSKARTRRAAAAAAAASIEQQAGSKTRSSSQRLSQPPAAAAEEPAAADGPRAAAEPAPGQAALNPAAANSTRSRLAALGIPDPDSAPMFLERVVMWWCGVPPGSSEHLELQSILHAYAGVRFPVLSDATTHIMVRTHTGPPFLAWLQAAAPFAATPVCSV